MNMNSRNKSSFRAVKRDNNFSEMYLIIHTHFRLIITSVKIFRAIIRSRIYMYLFTIIDISKKKR